MAFPTTPTVVRMDLNIAGTWTNVTGDLYTAEGVNITRGRTDEASAPQASALTFALNNRTGNYTPRNPTGAYYPNLTRNTPVRVGVGIPPAGTGLGNQSGTAIVAPASTAEVAGIAFSCWSVESAAATITTPGGYTALTTINGSLASSRAASIAVGVGAVGAATATSSVSAANSAATCVIPGATTLVTTAVTSQNYAYASEFTPVQVGPFTILAGDVLVACVVWSQDPFNSMVASPWDDSQASEWSLTADSGITVANSPRTQIWTRYCPAAASLNVQSVNWILGVADLQMSIFQVRGASPWNPRYHGFCMDFETTADLSGKDVRCTVNAGSVLRQRGQGQQPARSPFYRYLSNSNSVAYWPLEGGTQTQALASPFPGVAPAVITSISTAFGSDSTSFVASDSLPVLTAGYVSGPVPSYTASGGAVYGAVYIPTAPTNLGQGIIWATLTGGTLGTAIITYASSTSFTVTIFNTAGASVFTSTVSGTQMIGVPRYWYITWNPNVANPGTQTDFAFGYIDATSGVAPSIPQTVTGTVGAVSRVALGQEPSNTVFFDKGLTVGHMAVASSASNSAGGTGTTPTSTIPRFAGLACAIAWRGEFTFDRFLRICQEESIPVSLPLQVAPTFALLPTVIQLGTQAIDNALDILATTQATDIGEMAESRCTTGILYRTGASMTAQPVAVTVDYAGKMIAGQFQPVDDDQLTRNDVTVTQQSGPSVEVTQATGTLSVLNPPQGVGVYTQSVDVTLFNQARDLPQVAALYLAQGTVDQQRFKNVEMLLAAAPASVTALSSMDIGNHVQIVNTPTWVQPGPSDVVVLGLQEMIGPIAEWNITFNAKPYGVNAVLRAGGGDTMARLDSGSSTLTSTITNSATSISVSTARADDLWGTLNLPYDILISGERMTVTAVTGATSPQTFTVTRSVNGVVKTHAAGDPVHVYYQTFAGLAGQ